jgi:hypothetical protein
MTETRTMYMHTLDGRPANIQRWTRGDVSFFYAVGRNRARLVPSLAQIRSEQREYFLYLRARGSDVEGERHALSYVLVEVPVAASRP